MEMHERGDVGPIEALSLLSVQRVHIHAVLRASGWDRVEAARVLGIGLRTLYNWLDDLALVGFEIQRQPYRHRGRDGARAGERRGVLR